MTKNSTSKIDYISSNNKIFYLIEEDSQVKKILTRKLEYEFPGFEVQCIENYETALDKIIHQKPQVIITSMELSSGENCFDSLLKPLLEKELTKKIPVIVTAVRSDLKREEDNVGRFSIDIVPKPIRSPLLVNTVDEAMKRSNSVNAQTINLDAKEILFREGEPGENMYFLKSGELDVFKQVGEEFTHLATISTQQLVGEMAFLDGGARTASIVCRTSCELIQLNLGDIKKFISEQPFWLGMMIETLTNRIKETNRKLSEAS